LTSARITLPYPLEDRIRRLLGKLKIDIIDMKYQNNVMLLVEFPETLKTELNRQIGDQSMGQAKLLIT
jgi:putative IMPACT (imprinted ancient) family translation regulator